MTVAHQAPLPMGFLRQENWSGLPFPSPGNLSHPEIEPVSPALADSLPLSQQGSPKSDKDLLKGLKDILKNKAMWKEESELGKGNSGQWFIPDKSSSS